MIKDKKIEADKTEATMLEKIKEGFKYVFKTKIILYSISIDMFSVLFGGVVAILPVFSQDILKVGPEGLGIMRAVPSIGAVIVLLILSKFPPMKSACTKFPNKYE